MIYSTTTTAAATLIKQIRHGLGENSKRQLNSINKSFLKRLLNLWILLEIFLVLINQSNNRCEALHLKGTFKTNEFFKFITRFGFQATDIHDEYSTQGYIYGNITLVEDESIRQFLNRTTTNGQTTTNRLPADSLIMLTVMDYHYFIDYYNKRRIKPRTTACSMMFEKIDKMAFFYDCNENGHEDFIRRVPCIENGFCIDEDNKDNVMKGFQFTFKIRDLNQARFWYISFVSCTRNKCEWRDLSDYGKLIDMMSSSDLTTTLATTASLTQNMSFDNMTTFSDTTSYSTAPPYSDQYDTSIPIPSYTIAYDIWLVNGNPMSKSKSRFEHQFTCELHDIFEIYLSSLIIYLFILPFIIYRLYLHFHYLYLQLLIYASIEVACRILSLIHNLVFSFDGNGVYVFEFASNFLESLASSFLILILISIAKGWTVRSRRLKTSKKFYLLGFLLQFVLVISHMVALDTIDPVFNTNSYETFAGRVELSIRFVCMVWFLIELKETFNNLEIAATSNHRESTTAAPSTTTSATIDTTNRQRDSNRIDSASSEMQIVNDDDNEMDSDLDEDDYEIKHNGKRYASLSPNRHENQNRLLPDGAITRIERLKSYQKFYLHYGACSLVWFIYLPVLIFITSFVSELYRFRLVLSIRYFVNFISVVVLFYIMWSPKTPLRLPGKKASNRHEFISMYFLNSDLIDNIYYAIDENDEDEEDTVVFSAQQTNNLPTINRQQ